MGHLVWREKSDTRNKNYLSIGRSGFERHWPAEAAVRANRPAQRAILLAVPPIDRKSLLRPENYYFLQDKVEKNFLCYHRLSWTRLLIHPSEQIRLT